ncbi:hypothetical protein M9H77_02462 [Catharanthus roseus]|uniref:Uncharacterized protein n=1 Tax=Catharanthus roseus TaxID=4058 RepID=A0ACC0C8M7_CATRO|nr:hypothetical protein M9H77_02462 [Catharanthus roseus]
MGSIGIIPTLFHDIGWGSLLIVNEPFYPMMLYEFIVNLQRGRTQSGGNVISSRVNGKNIVLDDKLLNSILETHEDGMCFCTKNRKCFDPNLYSEKRKIFQHFEINFVGVGDHISPGKIYNQNTFRRMGFERNDEGLFIRGGEQGSDDDMMKSINNGDEEEGNEPESMDDEEEDIRRAIRSKKRQERTEEGQSSVDTAQILDRIAAMEAQLNDRLDLNDKIADIQNRVTRLEQGGKYTDEDEDD